MCCQEGRTSPFLYCCICIIKIHLGNEWNTLKAWWNKISIFSAFKGQELGYASMGLSAIGILCKRNGKEML
jgi:hypothetical protein